MARWSLLVLLIPFFVSASDWIEIDLAQVHPTQARVGFVEIERKRREVLRMDEDQLRRFYRQIAPEVVLGPGKGVYILDKHHDFLALLSLGQRRALGRQVGDYSHMSQSEFEEKMIEKGYVYLKSINNRRTAFRSLPKLLIEMTDDPYRSLAGQVRRADGYSKSGEIFAEWRWAERLRRVVPLEVLQSDPIQAVRMGMAFARSSKSQDLPGAKSPRAISCRRAHLASWVIAN